MTNRDNTPGCTAKWLKLASLFVRLYQRDLSMPARAVWWTIWSHSRNGFVTIGQDQIVREVGWNGEGADRIARRYICELIEAGLLRIERRGNRSLGPTRYQLVNRTNEVRLKRDSQPDPGGPPASGPGRSALSHRDTEGADDRFHSGASDGVPPPPLDRADHEDIPL